MTAAPTWSLSLAQVRKLEPCEEAMARLSAILPERDKIDAAQARALGCTYDDIIWAASMLAMRDETLARRLTHYLNDNAKRVLHIFERDVPDDNRPRLAIEATDKWLAGQITEAEWRKAAWDAWDARAARAARAAWVAWVAWDARAAWTSGTAFQVWQYDRLVYWLTEPEPAGLPMPEKEIAA